MILPFCMTVLSVNQTNAFIMDIAWKINEKTIELKKISVFIIIKTRLSTVTINLRKNDQKKERNKKTKTKYEKKI